MSNSYKSYSTKLKTTDGLAYMDPNRVNARKEERHDWREKKENELRKLWTAEMKQRDERV